MITVELIRAACPHHTGNCYVKAKSSQMSAVKQLGLRSPLSQKTPNNQMSCSPNTAPPLHKVEKWFRGWQNSFLRSLGNDGPFSYCSSLAQDSHTDSSHHICLPDSQKEVARKRHLLSKDRAWQLFIVYWLEHSHEFTHSCKGGWEV